VQKVMAGGHMDCRVRSPFGDVDIEIYPSGIDPAARESSMRELLRLLYDFKNRQPEVRRALLAVHARLEGLSTPDFRGAFDRDTGPSHAEAISAELLFQARAGNLVLRRAERRAVVVPRDVEGEPVLGPVSVAETDWVGFVVVDDATNAPIPSVALAITLPDGSKSNLTTGADGSAEVKQTTPGLCTLQVSVSVLRLSTTLSFLREGGSPPPPDTAPKDMGSVKPKIAKVIQHQMLAGETLGKVAEDNGLTLQALTHFNFETADPKKLDRQVRLLMGCRQRAGDDWLFDGTEKPGMVYVPKELSLAAMRTGTNHVLRVAALNRPLKPFLFSY